MTHLTGGCQCGAVRYALTAAPTNPHVCHCRMCQKAVGAPFGALATVALADFAWTRGEPAWFRSSEAAERGFCRDCGTSLPYRRVGGERIDVALAPLGDPGAVTPTRQIGVEGRLSWIARLPELPEATTDALALPDAAARAASRQHPDGESG